MKILAKSKNWLFTLILMVLFVSALYVLFKYDTEWSDKVDTDVVFVANADIKDGESFTKNNSARMKIKTKYIPMNAIANDKFIGWEATHHINKGEILTVDDAEQDSIILRDGETIMALPDSWIINIPDTLRRKDLLDIYLQKDQTQAGQIISPDTGTVVTPKMEISAQNLAKINQAVKNSEPILKDIMVAYLRDGSNGEVLSADNPIGQNGSNERLKGSSVPKMIEAVMSSYDASLIKDAIDLGYKLVVGYKSTK